MIEDGASKEDFQVELLGEYSLEECLEREKELAMTSLFPKGLNGNAGCYIEITDDVKKKMSLASKGKPKSEEHKRKNSEAQKGKTISEEQRRKISNSLKGRTRPEEVKEKIRAGHSRRSKDLLNED